jgi:hypothetical protein
MVARSLKDVGKDAVEVLGASKRDLTGSFNRFCATARRTRRYGHAPDRRGGDRSLPRFDD